MSNILTIGHKKIECARALKYYNDQEKCQRKLGLNDNEYNILIDKLLDFVTMTDNKSKSKIPSQFAETKSKSSKSTSKSTSKSAATSKSSKSAAASMSSPNPIPPQPQLQPRQLHQPQLRPPQLQLRPPQYQLHPPQPQQPQPPQQPQQYRQYMPQPPQHLQQPNLQPQPQFDPHPQYVQEKQQSKTQWYDQLIAPDPNAKSNNNALFSRRFFLNKPTAPDKIPEPPSSFEPTATRQQQPYNNKISNRTFDLISDESPYIININPVGTRRNEIKL